MRVEVRAPCLMRIINMAWPAPLNAGEDWEMGDKNKTSQAYPHKIHEAGACKKDIAQAGSGKGPLNLPVWLGASASISRPSGTLIPLLPRDAGVPSPLRCSLCLTQLQREI
ncbi:unnamed protein product [Pleuronectes platessa]|uniref:Uncharacterized protein n=1 Tax=Pleuronectes platessa TaxID=8262 RepID=A0A9N7VKG6_PLEPL|nr:unnamed protein product [Pleuronectes platessa]